MMPTPSDVHVNGPLTQISIAFLQSASDFVATRVFPNIPVSKQSDRYYTYDRGEFNRDQMQERAPSTESAGGGYTLDNTPTYFCREYSLHKDVPDQVRNNADAVVNPDREAAIFLTHQALIRREKIFTTSYFIPGVWGTEYAGVAAGPTGNQRLRWSDAASNPIEDVRYAKRMMRSQTGFEPNKLTLGRPVYDALVDHPDIIDRVKYGQTSGAPARGTLQALMALLEIEEILVMNAIENTAKEGQAAAHSFIGGNHALLAYAAATPGLMTPSAGYTFSWTGQPGSGADGLRVRTIRMDPIRSDRHEIDLCVDMKRIATELGAMFTNIV